MTSTSWRALLVPVCSIVALSLNGCGSSPSFDTGPDEDTGVVADGAGDTSNGGDTINGGDTKPNGDTTPGGETLPAVDAPGADTTPPPIDAPATDTPPTCAAGTSCGTACVDTNTDPVNCGGCGKKVCHDEICSGGTPTCYPGFKACGSTGCLGCRDIQSDPENCGDCGNRCGTGQLCSEGKCATAALGCSGGLTACGSTFGTRYCANTDTDPANCGGCLKQCAPTQFCAGGKCVEYTGAPGCTTCGGCSVCTDPTSKCCTFGGAAVCASDCG